MQNCTQRATLPKEGKVVDEKTGWKTEREGREVTGYTLKSKGKC